MRSTRLTVSGNYENNQLFRSNWIYRRHVQASAMTWDPAPPTKGGWYCSFYNEVMDNIPTTASSHAAGSCASLVPEPRTTISSTDTGDPFVAYILKEPAIWFKENA
jgi:hypothetical protein